MREGEIEERGGGWGGGGGKRRQKGRKEDEKGVNHFMLQNVPPVSKQRRVVNDGHRKLQEPSTIMQ